MNAIVPAAYKAVRSPAYAPNFNALHMLYLPIVGAKAVALYGFLAQDAEMQGNYPSIVYRHDRIAAALKASAADLEESRARLEAMGLLSTYVEGERFTYEVKSPLAAEGFLAREEFSGLLAAKLGSVEFDRTVMALTPRGAPANAVNVTRTFGSVFRSLSDAVSLDVPALERLVSAQLRRTLSIDESAAAALRQAARLLGTGVDALAVVVCRSLADEDGELRVDAEALDRNIAALCVPKAVETGVRPVRDAGIFTSILDDATRASVMQSYVRMNAESYLTEMQGKSLSLAERTLLRSLLDGMALPDEVVNVCVDFSVFRGRGNLNAKYLTEVAKTLNRQRVRTADTAVAYFREALAGAAQARRKTEAAMARVSVPANKYGPARPSCLANYDPAGGPVVS